MPFHAKSAALWLQQGQPMQGSVNAPAQNDGYLNRPLDQLFDNTDYLKAEVDSINSALGGGVVSQAALESIYRIGAVYINADDPTNPSVIFGFGTWVKFASGRVLIGEGTSTADINGDVRNYTMGVTSAGTAKTWTFTVSTGADASNYQTFVLGTSNVHIPPSSTATQVADALSAYSYDNDGSGIDYVTNVGADVTVHMRLAQGDVAAPSITEPSTVTTTAPSIGVAYVAPVYGKTGGEYGHALDAHENGEHKHEDYSSYSNLTGSGLGIPQEAGNNLNPQANDTTRNSGIGEKHNNVQPYTTVYIWKRTA